jgi:hypothetical protein
MENIGAEYSGLPAAISVARKSLENLSAEYEDVIKGSVSSETGSKVRKLFYELQEDLAKTASAALIFANDQWKQEGYRPSQNSGSGREDETKDAVVEPPAKDLTLRSVERFLCLFYLNVIVVGLVYGQIYANPLLSRISSTKPGELGLDFWVRLGTFVFIPLLSLLSVQFPAINNFLFSWLQPALQSVK